MGLEQPAALLQAEREVEVSVPSQSPATAPAPRGTSPRLGLALRLVQLVGPLDQRPQGQQRGSVRRRPRPSAAGGCGASAAAAARGLAGSAGHARGAEGHQAEEERPGGEGHRASQQPANFAAEF